MEGLGGRRGWSWIFIIPGAITVFLAIPIFFFVSDFPENANWLSPGEIHLIQTRLQADRGERLDDKITIRKALKDLTDWRVWVLASLLFFSHCRCLHYVILHSVNPIRTWLQRCAQSDSSDAAILDGCHLFCRSWDNCRPRQNSEFIHHWFHASYLCRIYYDGVGK